MESNDKTAEEIELKRIEKEADNYAFEVPYNGTKDFYDMKKYEGYMAGATHEFNRSAQQLKEYREVIKELLPLAESGQAYYRQNPGFNWVKEREKSAVIIHKARKLIDQTDSTK